MLMSRGVLRAAEPDVAAGRADIADRDRHVARQLALDVHGILVDLRVALVLIDEVDGAADAGQQAGRELPIGCSRPPGNGLSRIARGTSLSALDWMSAVVRVKPI